VYVRNSTPTVRGSRIWRWYYDADIWKCIKTHWRWSITQAIGQWFWRVHRFSLLCHIIIILPALPISVRNILYILYQKMLLENLVTSRLRASRYNRCVTVVLNPFPILSRLVIIVIELWERFFYEAIILLSK
jgi:hypothetical protein